MIWPQLIGYMRAKEYLLTGDAITGEEAAKIGLINRAVESEELDAAVDQLAQRLANGAAVFVGVGERDVCPNPLLEPSAFKRSRDVSVYIAPQMAHMHNFASTRRQFWDRIVEWSLMIARAGSK